MKYATGIVGGILLLLISGSSVRKMDYREGMHINVCKDLHGDMLVYHIFVDTKHTLPWTEFDINSTIDSMAVAARWMEKQAEKFGVQLRVKTDYYIGEQHSTIFKDLPGGSVIKSATDPSLKKGLEELSRWADYIARKTGESFHTVSRDGIPLAQKPRNKERVIAYLRDEYMVENVALLFMVNNYYRSDISIAVNTFNAEDVEFAIVSFKYPAEIAHNILHLFGAADLYGTPFRKSHSKIKSAAEHFPDDIMQDPYARGLSDAEIGEFTAFLIGWSDYLDPAYTQLLTDRMINF